MKLRIISAILLVVIFVPFLLIGELPFAIKLEKVEINFLHY